MVILIGLSTGCGGKEQQNKEVTTLGEAVEISYAKGFAIYESDNFTQVIIHNPWTTEEDKPYATYYIYKDETDDIPNNGIKIQQPIASLIVNTFSYFEFLQQLGELETVIGVSDAERIYNARILEKLELDEIANLGDPFKPNLEKSLTLQADAVIASAYAQQDTYNEQIMSTGIPIIYSLEWMEDTPLARAEWMKLIAVFFGKLELAQELFEEIETRYNATMALVTDIAEQPTILAGDNFQDTWYLPGGGSFNAQIFKDAGIDYYYKDDEQQGSIGLDIETVLTQLGSSDFWFGCEANSYQELERKDKKYLLLKPVKEKRVFSNRNRVTPTGGNDYFEGAVAHPDLLLRDLIKAAHPQLMENEPFTYLKPLK